MNQEKIGKFISECRKSKNLTQESLAEMLGVSNRTVSKWENGKCMPDYSILPILCENLDITINELLSGERLEVDKQYQKKLEENIILNMDVLKKKMWKTIKVIFFCIICFIVFCFTFALVFLSIYQTKYYLSDEELDVKVCMANDNIALIIKSLDGQGIMVDSTRDGQKSFFRVYRYKYSKQHKEFSSIENIIFPKENPDIYFNNKLIYEDGMDINKCY